MLTNYDDDGATEVPFRDPVGEVITVSTSFAPGNDPWYAPSSIKTVVSMRMHASTLR